MAFFLDYRVAFVTFFVFALSMYFSLKLTELNNGSFSLVKFIVWPSSARSKNTSSSITFPDDFYMSAAGAGEESNRSFSLEYDFYRDSCPDAEKIVRDMVRAVYGVKPTIAPALVRLMFHDCFIEGCDASVLLDSDQAFDSEKDSPPNRSLKGFDIIDIIKSELENECPGVVSCADILVLAAREAIVVSGGPFYPLYTGRKDSLVAFQDMATYEIPPPHADLSETLASFASRGFDERETVSLLGAHSIGVVHCKFFEDRLYNFSGTGQPDPSLDPELLKDLKSKCGRRSPSSTSAPSPPPISLVSAPSDHLDGFITNSNNATDQEINNDMSFQEPHGDGGFGTQYYRNLLQNKGLLFSDQQLMAGEETAIWVRAYASDPILFQRDFAQALMKLSNLHVLTGLLGQVRRNCSKVA